MCGALTQLAVPEGMPCLRWGASLTVCRDYLLWESQCLQVSKAQDVRASKTQESIGHAWLVATVLGMLKQGVMISRTV